MESTVEVVAVEVSIKEGSTSRPLVSSSSPTVFPSTSRPMAALPPAALVAVPTRPPAPPSAIAAAAPLKLWLLLLLAVLLFRVMAGQPLMLLLLLWRVLLLVLQVELFLVVGLAAEVVPGMGAVPPLAPGHPLILALRSSLVS